MGLHLPLNPVDQVNQPPLYFLQVQDFCILLMGPLWTTAYILYVRQGFKDKSYGMPMAALCLNIAWELIYGVFYPQSPAETATFVPWFLIDLVIAYMTVKHGRDEWKHAPMVANNLGALIAFGSCWAFALIWALTNTCAVDVAAFWSGFACQLFLGTCSVAHLLSKDSTRGHSLSIWACRWIGSTCAVVMFEWRYWHYPDDYPLVGSPMAIFLFVSFQIVDLTYPFVYKNIAKREALREKSLKQL